MNSLTQKDKSIMVQGCINSYRGQDGLEVWAGYDMNTLKYWDVECNEGFTSEYDHPTYTQLYGDFIPYISVIDLLFNCGDKSLDVIRKGGENAIKRA